VGKKMALAIFEACFRFVFALHFRTSPKLFLERVCWQNKNMAANLGAAQIVIFSVQFACAGICRHFLVRG